jgi:hypothetical protein
MQCTACGGELILGSVVAAETLRMRGCESHTYICSGCHVTERRLVFTKHGREDHSRPVPTQAEAEILLLWQLRKSVLQRRVSSGGW